jgi:uncharacterized membrane protein
VSSLDRWNLIIPKPRRNEKERILVVVFDNEKEAYEGESALMQLQREGLVTVFNRAVVVKHAEGTVSLKQIDDEAPIGSLAGTAVGGMVGLLGGPVGAAIGAGSGLALGALFDLDRVLVGSDFLDDVSKSLTPNKVAVVAEVEEEWTTPVDTRMEALGGSVLRRALWDVQQTLRDEEVAAMKADLKQFKTEIADARDDRRAKLQKKIDQLQARVDAQVEKAKEQHVAFEARQKSKRDVLKSNAAAAGRALKDLAHTSL